MAASPKQEFQHGEQNTPRAKAWNFIIYILGWEKKNITKSSDQDNNGNSVWQDNGPYNAM